MGNLTNNTVTALPHWVHYQQLSYSGIVTLIGIPGNILIILVFAYSRERSSTDYMVFTMAVSDLVGSFVCTSFTILQNLPYIWAQIGSTLNCRLDDFFGLLTAVCSMWLLSIIAVDRYMKTCRPHSVFITISKARTICVIVCALVATLAGPASLNVRFDSIKGVCIAYQLDNWSTTITINTLIAGICVSFVITAVAYVFVAFALWKRLQNKKKQRRAIGCPKYIATVMEHDKGRDDGNCGKDRNKNTKDKCELDELGCNAVDLNDKSVIGKEMRTLGYKMKDELNTQIRAKEQTGIDRIVCEEQKRLNRTTIIMFLITAINISTFVLLMVGNMLVESRVTEVGFIFGYMLQTSYLVNFITNPLLYMVMSSKFRENVRKLGQRR